MRLSFEQIKSATTGISRIKEEADGIFFYRFSEEEEALYRQKRSESMTMKTFSTSGVRLRFRTDSRYLDLKVTVAKGSGRKYFSFDLSVNGKFVDSLNNYAQLEMIPPKFTTLDVPQGDFEKRFLLCEGEKEIKIDFPWSSVGILRELSLEDGAGFTPVRAEKTLLVYGDSITHGYDALHPCNKYITRLADALGAQEQNKAIGGEVFFPELAAIRNEAPDYVTVAYGTNDWSKTETYEIFRERCASFYRNLSENYPDAVIFAIAPIWRADFEANKKVGKFSAVEETIREVCSELKNVRVIAGFDLVDKDPAVYADFRLHPNDIGFDSYFKNLRNGVFAELEQMQ